MSEVQFTTATLEAVVGFVLSLLLENVPKLKEAWADAGHKALILFCAFEGVTLLWWALGCWGGVGLPATGIPCGPAGLGQALIIGALGFAGSQAGYGVAARYSENAVARQ